jgi:hypothetical protein
MQSPDKNNALFIVLIDSPYLLNSQNRRTVALI